MKEPGALTPTLELNPIQCQGFLNQVAISGHLRQPEGRSPRAPQPGYEAARFEIRNPVQGTKSCPSRNQGWQENTLSKS